MIRRIFKILVLLLLVWQPAGAAFASSAEIADRSGLESVWLPSGRTTRVIDYPFSPQPGQFGEIDTRAWGNHGYLFINPNLEEFEEVIFIPPEEKASPPPEIWKKEDNPEISTSAAARIELPEEKLEKNNQELERLRTQFGKEAIKRRQLERQFPIMEQAEMPREGRAVTVIPEGEIIEEVILSPGVHTRLVAEKTDTYLVSPGETLWEIAGEPLVYNDPHRSLLLYRSNRDQIFGPDLIYPGMILLVPPYPEIEFSQSGAVPGSGETPGPEEQKTDIFEEEIVFEK